VRGVFMIVYSVHTFRIRMHAVRNVIFARFFYPRYFSGIVASNRQVTE
jgi:hypothetical protein